MYVTFIILRPIGQLRQNTINHSTTAYAFIKSSMSFVFSLNKLFGNICHCFNVQSIQQCRLVPGHFRGPFPFNQATWVPVFLS